MPASIDRLKKAARALRPATRMRPTIGHAVAHAAETDARDFQAGLAEGCVVHVRILFSLGEAARAVESVAYEGLLGNQLLLGVRERKGGRQNPVAGAPSSRNGGKGKRTDSNYSSVPRLFEN